MLVQFSFKNFGAFREKTTFDMRAIKTYKEHPYNLEKINDKNSLIKVAAVYGANASGKSNFINAYHYFVNLVRESMNISENQKESILSEYYNPFLFTEDNIDNETEFEAIYIGYGHEYTYGFTYNKNEIGYEWLYKKNLLTNRKITVFEREKNKILLGASFKKSCEKYVTQVESDVLTLSFFNRLRLRTQVFKEAFDCTQSILAMSYDINIKWLFEEFFKDDFDNFEKERLLKFLNCIDTGIKDITIEKNKKNIQVNTHHTGLNGEDYCVPIDIESDGTKKAIIIFSFFCVALEYGKGLIIDELNTKLHPLLLKYLIDLFYKEDKFAQLIYTTHDTSLLDKRYFRRDQVWFVEKDALGKATLYSLAEFKVRNDASFEKEYLGGLYGGIPILSDCDWEN